MRRYIGLMSGTSADAIDAVLIECEATRFVRVAAAVSGSYPPALRHSLLQLARDGGGIPLEALAELDAAVAEAFAETALRLLHETGLDTADICAIGSHGQTVFHRGGSHPLTLQIGDGGRIAERCGMTVVADFRRRDVALGGQGAPLVPAFHHALYADATEARAVLNLGGIANLTLLPDAGTAQVRGFDTGPANSLLDEWCLHHHGRPHDDDGRWAAQGHVDEALLEALLADPYFALPPPKSTGRGDFHVAWARQRDPRIDRLAAADVQASFAELTARTIAEALRRTQPQTQRLLVCGGGVRNGDLMRRLAQQLGSGVSIESTQARGLDPQHVEAAAFAWLAMRTLARLPGNLPGVTGARRETVLGAVYAPPA